MSKNNRVFLIGFSGCGKSTVGPLLARQCQAGFIDTDQVIERMAGMNIADIFVRESQLFFRRLESEVIKSRRTSISQ